MNPFGVLALGCGTFIAGFVLAHWSRDAEAKEAYEISLEWQAAADAEIAATKRAYRTIDVLHIELNARAKELADWRVHGVKRDPKTGRILTKETTKHELLQTPLA